MKIKSKIIMVMSLLSLALIFAAPIAVLAHGNERNDDNGRHLGRTVSVERSSGNGRHGENETEFEFEDDHDEDEDNDRNRRRGRGNRKSATSTPRVINISPVATPRVPVISNIRAFVGTSSIQFVWNTNVPTDSQVYVSTTSPVVIGATTTRAFTQDSLVNRHSVTVTGLTPNTAFNFIVRSANSTNMLAADQFSITI